METVKVITINKFNKIQLKVITLNHCFNKIIFPRFHHMRQIHVFATQLCEICTRTFRNYECLRRHKYKVHDSIKCKGCGSRVLKKSVDEHEAECSNHLEPKVEHERNFHCASCEKAYSSSFLLRRHMRDKHNYVVVSEDSKFTCSTCSEEFDSKMLYNRHIKVCNCLQCSICSAPFKTTEKLDQHMLKHAEEKAERQFQCPQCTCRYSTASTLSCHVLKRHTNEQSEVGINFECPHCDQMYRKSILLKIHLETKHKVIKESLESVCVICDEDCGDNLPNHTRNEHKKVHKCHHGKCKKSYRTAESLASHEKSHEENFVPDLSCSACHKILPNQKALLEHFKKHAKLLPV